MGTCAVTTIDITTFVAGAIGTGIGTRFLLAGLANIIRILADMVRRDI